MNVRSRTLWFTGLAGLLLFCSLGSVRAQQSEPAAKPKAEEVEKQPVAYRLDFSISELEEGKNVNSRQYSLNLNAGDSNNLKIGTRIPVEAKQGEFQYIDVGTNIWAGLREHSNGLTLAVRADITNFATPDPQNHSMPMIRQLQINGSTVVLLGKPLVIGSADDPNSKRQFQLTVVVTKIR